MKRYYKLLNLRSLATALGSLFLLASCSSYQYAGYDNDGIYSSPSNGEAYTDNDYEESYEDALYYKNLFGEKAEQFEAVPADGAIFTDIESYSSGQYDENMFGAEGLEYEPGRAAWGTDPDEIAINVYNNYPHYSPFYYGYGYPYAYYGGFYDPFWGPRYYRYGFYDPFYYGHPYAYNSWRWNIGFGFGWGGYYGYGHRYSPWYPYGHYYDHYPRMYRRDVAYNASRRDAYSDTYRDRRAVSSDSRISRIQGYSNSRNVRAAGTRVNDSRTYQTRSTRVRSTSTRSDDAYRSSSQRRSVPAVRSGSYENSRPAVRSSRSSRSNNSTYRSSSSSTRSTSSGTRSSSSSRSSRGRGGN